jgi:hypothetical protein
MIDWNATKPSMAVIARSQANGFPLGLLAIPTIGHKVINGTIAVTHGGEPKLRVGDHLVSQAAKLPSVQPSPPCKA